MLRSVAKIIFFLTLCFVQNDSHSREGSSVPQFLSKFQEKFDNVLLIINFNSPYYSNIPFLKKLYGSVFSKIVFYGYGGTHPEVTSFNTLRGFDLFPVVDDVLTRYPDFQGYLFLQDDCILNVWNCLSLDLNKLWLPHATLTPSNWEFGWYQFANMVDPRDLEWSALWGFKEMKQGWSQLLSKDLNNLNQNAGENNVPGAQCDMFYIPQSYRLEALRLNSYFRGVFCEYAIPIIISCLDLKKNWERTSLFWDYQGVLPTDATCVHPVKLSSIENREHVQSVFDRWIIK